MFLRLSSKLSVFAQVASEPLTFEKGVHSSFPCSLHLLLTGRCFTADWMEIRTNHMVVITPKMNLLQIPIIDKYFVKPSDPEWSGRDTDFAAGKGLLSPRKEMNTKLTDISVPPTAVTHPSR